MTRAVHGRAYGKTIELDEDLGVPHGQEVEVQVTVAREAPPPAQVRDRTDLIYSLPGRYSLISSDEYLEEKRREAAQEDR